MKTSWLVLALAAAVLSFAGLGIAASQETYKVSAHLTGSQETPKNTSKATGSFTGTVVEKGESKTLKWKLTFKGLSGAAQAAHVHLGKKGVSGPVAVPLCGPASPEHTARRRSPRRSSVRSSITRRTRTSTRPSTRTVRSAARSR